MSNKLEVVHQVAGLAGNAFRLLVDAGGEISTEAILKQNVLPNSKHKENSRYVRNKLLEAKRLLTRNGVIQQTSPHAWKLMPDQMSRSKRAVIDLIHDAIVHRRHAPASSARSKYTARICWNSNGWRFPSGEARHLETGTHVANTGFGHEEWLFNFAWLIGDYHYAFLQPVNKSLSALSGNKIDVLLYAISPADERLYVGEIVNCEVLSERQAADAVSVYRERGWIKSMQDQILAVGGKAEYISDAVEPTDILNVRFQPGDADIYDPPKQADRKDAVWQRQRYTLSEAGDEIARQWRTRKGSSLPPLIRTITRDGSPGVTYDPIHMRLQAELMKLLRERYGNENVVREADFVDLTVRCGAKRLLIEIKTNPHARGAIREALGQLLEYAYYGQRDRIAEQELIVIAPGTPDPAAQKYLDCLREQFGIPISYCVFSEGESLPERFKQVLP